MTGTFPVVNFGALERYRVPAADWSGRLTDMDPADREGMPFPRPEAEAATASDIAEIDRMQEILYAQSKHALLVVLQGSDAFKKPTPHELAHDFLWRIHKAVPAAGMIGIFNRSHYEDVLVARVHGLVPPERIEARYDQINRFERHLVENDVTILKFFLHISRKEQRARLQARLDDPTKRWKFNPDDLAERKHWDDYMSAYQTAFERCSSEWAPWFIVPANHKWYRNAVIARVVRSTLEALDLTYPPEMAGLDKIRIE